MKETISRTIKFAEVTVKVYDSTTDAVTEKKYVTTEKKTDKQYDKAVASLVGETETVIKITGITVKSELLEMPLETFIELATKVESEVK